MTPNMKSARNATIFLCLFLVIAGGAIGWWMAPWEIIVLATVFLVLGAVGGIIIDNRRTIFYIFAAGAIVMGVAYIISHRIYSVVRFQHF